MESDTPDSPDELFVQLFARHERNLRAFIRSMGLDWFAVDDVVQTISLVMWRKWDQFDPDTDFMQWARVIARFEVLKFRRKMARDRHVFRDDVMEWLADAAEELDPSIGRGLPCCFAAMSECDSREISTPNPGGLRGRPHNSRGCRGSGAIRNGILQNAQSCIYGCRLNEERTYPFIL